MEGVLLKRVLQVEGVYCFYYFKLVLLEKVESERICRVKAQSYGHAIRKLSAMLFLGKIYVDTIKLVKIIPCRHKYRLGHERENWLKHTTSAIIYLKKQLKRLDALENRKNKK